MAGVISAIVSGSIAEELELVKGDVLQKINGQDVFDLIDYNFLSGNEKLELEVLKKNGETWFFDLEKDEDEDIGIIFSANVFDGIRGCANNCLFCFVSQLPDACRDSLKLKDDDYRMSFLEGNFITGTNLTEADFQRISDLRLSPLYISVHAVDPEVRRRLLRNKRAGEIITVLRQLKENNVSFHGQVVLCPGINDGEVLEDTLQTLAALRPNLLSLAIVPVGLSSFQKNPEMRLYEKEQAQAVLRQVQKWQQSLGDDNFIFLADEFYLLCGQHFPDYEHYQDFAQLENGVGMARLFLWEWEQAKQDLPKELTVPRRLLMITGISGEQVLRSMVCDLQQVVNLQVELLAVPNTFFGPSVTVSGLVTGSCIEKALKEHTALPQIIIPDSMLKHDSELFLDGMTVSELEKKLNTKITAISSGPFSLLEAVIS